MRIKMVAFDLFGVVFTEGHMISATLMPLLPEHVKRSTVKYFYNQYTLNEISEKDFWQGLGLTETKKIRKDFLRKFVLDADLSTVLGQLKDHYRLAILSNLAKGWATFLTEKHRLAELFSPRVISGEVSCGKPDQQIGQHQRLALCSG